MIASSLSKQTVSTQQIIIAVFQLHACVMASPWGLLLLGVKGDVSVGRSHPQTIQVQV